MKIRSDYVSNSSSSSFVIIGERMDVSQFDIEAFSQLGQDEAYLLVLPNRGCEGDYIFNLTPELLMDFDMHQLDLTKGNIPIIKVKYYCVEGGYVRKASWLDKSLSDEWYDSDDNMNRKLKTDGIALPPDCKMFRFSKDYGTPKDRTTILEVVEDALKFG